MEERERIRIEGRKSYKKMRERNYDVREIGNKKGRKEGEKKGLKKGKLGERERTEEGREGKEE